MLTSFDGTTGHYEKDGDLVSVIYKTCVPQVRDCPENRQGVHEGDLTKYEKSSYFDAYINTFSCMHMPLNETSTKEAVITTTDADMKPLSVVRSDVYNTMNSLKFEPITQATFANAIEIKSNGNSIVVRNTDITIPGVLVVFKGTRDCTQQVNIGTITCMKYESNNYDFYQYGDNLIKISKGINVEEFITLKALT